MEPAAVDRILTAYTTDDLHAAYAAPNETGATSGERFFQLRRVNGKEIVVVRSGTADTAVFQPFTSLEALRAYLGEPPEPAKPRTHG
jgi:hypothetical protein